VTASRDRRRPHWPPADWGLRDAGRPRAPVPAAPQLQLQSHGLTVARPAGAAAHASVHEVPAATAAHPAGAFDSSAGHFGRASAGIDAFQAAGRPQGHGQGHADAHGPPAGAAPHRWGAGQAGGAGAHAGAHGTHHEQPAPAAGAVHHGHGRAHWDPHRRARPARSAAQPQRAAARRLP